MGEWTADRGIGWNAVIKWARPWLKNCTAAIVQTHLIMLKNLHCEKYIKYAALAALLYCVPVYFFLKTATWSQSWLLYLGNALFMVTVASFLLIFNRNKDENASSMSMIIAGSTVAILGVIVSVLLAFILLWAMIPDLFQAGPPEKVLTHAPASTIPDKANGLIFMILASCTIGNGVAGLFVCILFPFTLKGDQTKEKVPPKQAEV